MMGMMGLICAETEGDVARVVDELVGGEVVPPVATARRAAVQDELDAQVDLDPLPLAGDLDAVS